MANVIAQYNTKTGIPAFVVYADTTRSGKVIYRYDGKHGAGCGDLSDIADNIRITMATKRGIHFVSGTDIAA